MADADKIMEIGKELIGLARSQKVDIAVITGQDGEMGMSFAGSTAFLEMVALSMVSAYAQKMFVEKLGYNQKDALDAAVAALKDKLSTSEFRRG